MEFLRKWYPKLDATIYVPDPTWPTHVGIAENAGFPCEKYRYYDRSSKSFDIEGMLKDLMDADDESIFVFHVCAHNPTGCDPTPEQWQRILKVV